MRNCKRKDHDIAERASPLLAEMCACFVALFCRTQEVGEIGQGHDSNRPVARYQTDLPGLGLAIQRGQFDAISVAGDNAAGIGRLQPAKNC